MFLLKKFIYFRWCHAKFFKDVACGCFVRIGIGLNQGVPIYRVTKKNQQQQLRIENF